MHRNFFLFAGVLTIGLGSGVSAWLVAEWPNQRGNPSATGAVPESLAENLKERWKITLSDGIEATPVISDGKLYVGDFQGKFRCARMEDGATVWDAEIAAARAAAAVSGGFVIVGDLDGMVHALDANDGKPRWKFDMGGVIDSGPTIVADKVLVASQAGELLCLSLQEGKEQWRYETSDQLRCSPTVAEGRCFLGGCDGQLHQVDINTGKAIGSPLPLDGPTGATPAVLGDTAIVPTFGGMVFGLDWKKGESRWAYSDAERDQEFRTSAAVNADLAVVCSQGKRVTAIDMKTGKAIWQENLRRRSDASPVIAGDSVFVAATDGQLIRYDLKTGKLLWKHEIRGSFLASPAVSDGCLVAVTDKGEVLCFQ